MSTVVVYHDSTLSIEKIDVANTLLNPVAFLQIHISRLFMERHGLNPERFLTLNAQKDILGFLRLGYEPFHLTGDEGILEELDEYVFGAA